MHIRAIATALFGSLVLSACAQAREVTSLDGVPCSEIATYPKDATELNDTQLFIAARANDFGICVPENDARAFAYYKEGAERGSMLMMARLGDFHAKGIGTAPDAEKARYWFRSFFLTTPPPTKAFWNDIGEKWFSSKPFPKMFNEIAEQVFAETDGSPQTMMQHYRDLLSGNNVRRNTKAAVDWLERAVIQGLPEAQYEIALRYRDGDGVDQRAAGYFTYLTLAARGNHPPAQKELGKYYLLTAKEVFEKHNALVWLLRAQINGMDVEDMIAEAEQQLDSQHREWAREKAADFDFGSAR